MRFVILHHSLDRGEHWDLMLEHRGKLATWQLDRRPQAPADLPLPARRLADHRSAYLTYQGEISRGRGRVRRVDEGQHRMIRRSEVEWVFELAGRHLSGRFRLRHLDGDRWIFEAMLDETTTSQGAVTHG
ncbi:MAG: hypothetical protein IH988_01435 [Planctomycetes bacterium]|nr:hypothetical protein [Planctomycetota bacterium]